MISLIFFDDADESDVAIFDKLRPQLPDSVNTWGDFGRWLVPYNASFRTALPRATASYIDFEDEADAIVFKLKFGL